MKKTSLRIVLAAAAALVAGACSQPNGALSQSAVNATLKAPKLAVTPYEPSWLQEPSQQHLVSDSQRVGLRKLLKDAKVRRIPDSMYRSAEEGNRGDNSQRLFYLYGSNAQCLGARVVEQRVLLDDLGMDERTESALYNLLYPQLKLLFPELAAPPVYR